MDDFLDTFSQLSNGYFAFKTAEAQADATGQNQTTLQNSVEQTAGASQVPLTASQYEQVSTSNNTATGSLPFGLTQNQLLIGAALLAAVLFIKN